MFTYLQGYHLYLSIDFMLLCYQQRFHYEFSYPCNSIGSGQLQLKLTSQDVGLHLGLAARTLKLKLQRHPKLKLQRHQLKLQRHPKIKLQRHPKLKLQWHPKLKLQRHPVQLVGALVSRRNRGGPHSSDMCSIDHRFSCRSYVWITYICSCVVLYTMFV